MPNLVYDTPTPPSQLYSSSSAAPGAAFPASSLRPRFQQQPNQTVVTSTVLPKSRLREQYRPEMDFDLDGSSSDSTFSSTDLAADNNNSPRTKYAGAAPGAADENRPPLGYYRSPGYGDASMGAGMNDKQRFLDVQPSSRQHQQQQRGGSLGTRVDEHSDATLSSSTRSMSSDSEDEVAVQARQQRKQQFSAYPNKTSATANNITSTPYPGMGSTSNNISKSAFDGMARELRKEFDRIMHAGQEPTSSNNHVLTSARSNSSPPPFRTRRNSALQAHAVATSPSYVQDAPTPLPRGVLPRRPSSSAAAAPRPSAPATRDHERTPTTQRTSQRMFGQEIRFPRQDTAAPPASYQPPRFSPPKASITEQKQPAWQDYQAASPFRATSTTARPGTGPPDSTRPTSKPSFRAADSPGKHSNASSYAGVRVPDVTGLTEGLTSPSRIESGPSSHKHFSNANGSPISSGRTFRGTHEDPVLSSALSGLRRRLEALESENARSEAKVAELQDRLASRDTALPPQQAHNPTIRDNPEGFVQYLRNEVNKLQSQIEGHNRTLSHLQNQQPGAPASGTYSTYDPSSWQSVFASLREALQQLADQVMAVRKVLEDVLQSMKISYSPSPADADLLRPQDPGSAMPLRSCETGKAPRYPGTLGTYPPNQQPPPMDYRYSYPEPLRESPPQRSSSAPLVQAHPAEYRIPRTTSNPLPSRAKETVTAVREPLLDRAERILSSLPPRLEAHAPTTCDTCRRHFEGLQKPDTAAYQASGSLDDSHPGRHIHMHDSELPMQIVVTRALRDLEEDFAVHKRIYVDLSEEFKRMDPATPEVSRRKILASHLKESIDILEMKADEIKRLYDLLHYRSELHTTAERERLALMAKGIKSRFAL